MPNLTPTILNTRRLKLRWLDERDVAAQYAIYSDPQVARYGSKAAWTELAQAEESIAQVLEYYRIGTALCFGVELLDSGAMIGNVILRDFHEQSRRCEIGYSLASPYWRKGYVGEALAALVGYGFRELGLNRIEADVDPRNEASGRALERLGFRKEGYMPERWIVHGETADTVFYGLLKRDWDAR